MINYDNDYDNDGVNHDNDYGDDYDDDGMFKKKYIYDDSWRYLIASVQQYSGYGKPRDKTDNRPMMSHTTDILNDSFVCY